MGCECESHNAAQLRFITICRLEVDDFHCFASHRTYLSANFADITAQYAHICFDIDPMLVFVSQFFSDLLLSPGYCTGQSKRNCRHITHPFDLCQCDTINFPYATRRDNIGEGAKNFVVLRHKRTKPKHMCCLLPHAMLFFYAVLSYKFIGTSTNIHRHWHLWPIHVLCVFHIFRSFSRLSYTRREVAHIPFFCCVALRIAAFFGRVNYLNVRASPRTHTHTSTLFFTSVSFAR